VQTSSSPEQAEEYPEILAFIITALAVLLKYVLTWCQLEAKVRFYSTLQINNFPGLMKYFEDL